MQYSLTHHREYNRVFFYSLNKAVMLSKDIVLTGAMLLKLEQALKAKPEIRWITKDGQKQKINLKPI